MNKLSVKKMSLAFGTVGVLYYLGCIIIMALFDYNGTVMFFNMLLHGLDTTNIVLMDIPISQTIGGLIATSLLASVAGAIIALTYNFGTTKSGENTAHKV